MILQPSRFPHPAWVAVTQFSVPGAPGFVLVAFIGTSLTPFPAAGIRAALPRSHPTASRPADGRSASRPPRPCASAPRQCRLRPAAQASFQDRHIEERTIEPSLEERFVDLTGTKPTTTPASWPPQPKAALRRRDDPARGPDLAGRRPSGTDDRRYDHTGGHDVAGHRSRPAVHPSRELR